MLSRRCRGRVGEVGSRVHIHIHINIHNPVLFHSSIHSCTALRYPIRVYGRRMTTTTIEIILRRPYAVNHKHQHQHRRRRRTVIVTIEHKNHWDRDRDREEEQ